MFFEVKVAAHKSEACADVRLAPFCDATGQSDPFERLHDSIILHILNLVSDIKTLGRCSAVLKRFSALVPVVESVTVKVDCVVSGVESGFNVRAKGIFGHLIRFVGSSLASPMHALQHILGPKKAVVAAVPHHSPCEVLKSYRAIQKLSIEMPGGELGLEDGALIKWRAEFGSTLENCVILGAADHVKPQVEREKKASKMEFGRSWFLHGRYEDRRARHPAESVVSSGEDDSGTPRNLLYEWRAKAESRVDYKLPDHCISQALLTATDPM